MFSGLDNMRHQAQSETWISSELGGSCGFYKHEAAVWRPQTELRRLYLLASVHPDVTDASSYHVFNKLTAVKAQAGPVTT